MINSVRGRHAFDVFDDNDESRRIVRRTIDFLREELSRTERPDLSPVLTSRNLFHRLVNESQPGPALDQARAWLAQNRAAGTPAAGFARAVEDNTLTDAGYELMKRQRTADARLVFETAVELFPDSPNAYDSLGDYFEATGDRVKAVENARKALEKLHGARLWPQMIESIRRSAQGKIDRLGN
jgi:tetratricopeptide (TPR) repeat protein